MRAHYELFLIPGLYFIIDSKGPDWEGFAKGIAGEI